MFFYGFFVCQVTLLCWETCNIEMFILCFVHRVNPPHRERFDSRTRARRTSVRLKGPVSWYLLLLVFFMNQFPQICHWYQRHRRHICHRCNRHRWQTISSCWQLKKNLKKKNYLYANSTIQRCLKEINIFLVEDFSHLHWCQRHRWCTLSCEYLREI
jgi:hypothetical protein